MDEHKDRGIIHFQGAVDSYDPDNDPGFVELDALDEKGELPKQRYRDTSILTGDDCNEQQRIFDRLPLSQSNRAEFFNWLTTVDQPGLTTTPPNSKRQRQ